MHLGIRVSDADRAEHELPALRATHAPGECGTGFRVFTDPGRSSFGIVLGRHSTD
jgi:hypothetical protein